MIIAPASDELLAAAIDYAVRGWAVFPLRGKTPAIRGGRGVLDATTDIAQIVAWWERYRGANIGARVPENMFVLDVDPRNGGWDSLLALIARHDRLPATLMTFSGRRDGGRHYFYRRPPGKLSGKRLGPGIDIKTSAGYTVMAPSIHPDSGRRYTRLDASVASPPEWLIELITPQPIEAATRESPRRSRRGGGTFTGSVADNFCATTSWSDVLEPHGWSCADGDPDADGAIWLHPTHTSACSATVRDGCLFVYSTNTPFDVTEPGEPHGYTRFRAYAVLDHGGDLSAAARHLREVS